MNSEQIHKKQLTTSEMAVVVGDDRPGRVLAGLPPPHQPVYLVQILGVGVGVGGPLAFVHLQPLSFLLDLQLVPEVIVPLFIRQLKMLNDIFQNCYLPFFRKAN